MWHISGGLQTWPQILHRWGVTTAGMSEIAIREQRNGTK
jgi:hypothetical protein